VSLNHGLRPRFLHAETDLAGCRSILARNRMALERVALGQSLTAPQRKFVSQQAFRYRSRRIDAVEVAMRPCGARTEASGGRADHELYPRGTSDGRRLLIQGVRIERRIAVPKAAAVRTPGTRWFAAALEDTKILINWPSRGAFGCTLYRKRRRFLLLRLDNFSSGRRVTGDRYRINTRKLERPAYIVESLAKEKRMNRVSETRQDDDESVSNRNAWYHRLFEF